MSEMMAVQISGPGGAFELVKRPMPEPGPNTVRIKVQAWVWKYRDILNFLPRMEQVGSDVTESAGTRSHFSPWGWPGLHRE